MASKNRVPVIILEGSWWSNHETPLILPYFQALATTHPEIDLSHRTFRSADDIKYYVSKISKNANAFLYFACHGEDLRLKPADKRNRISQQSLLEALRNHKEGAVSFVHFGCCEMVDSNDRRGSHQAVLEASGAKWVSGYTKSIDWLQSTLLDLALVADVFIDNRQKSRRLKTSKKLFLQVYEQLARELGFSSLSRTSSRAQTALFPTKLRTPTK